MRSPPISPAMTCAPGQRVGVWLPSRIESVVALLACSKSGAICSPSLHRDHTTGEVVELMQRTRCVAFIWQNGYGADADKRDLIDALKAVSTLRHVYQLKPLAETDKAPFAELAPAKNDSAADKTDPNQIVYLAFTSGTTGKPKGVMHSDNTLLANARQLAKDWSIGNTSVVYTLSPLSHNLGFGAQVMALAMGARARHQRPAARREPRRPHSGDQHELPGRRAAERDRSAGRDAEARI